MDFEQWMRETFERDTLQDIVEHGADAGFPEISYYSDTVAVYERFEREIWDMLAEDAEEQGAASIPALIASFRIAPNIQTDTQFKNALCWYAVERVAWALVESGDDDAV